MEEKLPFFRSSFRRDLVAVAASDAKRYILIVLGLLSYVLALLYIYIGRELYIDLSVFIFFRIYLSIVYVSERASEFTSVNIRCWVRARVYNIAK